MEKYFSLYRRTTDQIDIPNVGIMDRMSGGRLGFRATFSVTAVNVKALLQPPSIPLVASVSPCGQCTADLRPSHSSAVQAATRAQCC